MALSTFPWMEGESLEDVAADVSGGGEEGGHDGGDWVVFESSGWAQDHDATATAGAPPSEENIAKARNFLRRCLQAV